MSRYCCVLSRGGESVVVVVVVVLCVYSDSKWVGVCVLLVLAEFRLRLASCDY